MTVAGFYFRPQMSNNWGPSVFNTWVGDPGRLVILDAILKTVEEENLIENVNIVGDYVKQELRVRTGLVWYKYGIVQGGVVVRNYKNRV